MTAAFIFVSEMLRVGMPPSYSAKPQIRFHPQRGGNRVVLQSLHFRHRFLPLSFGLQTACRYPDLTSNRFTYPALQFIPPSPDPREVRRAGAQAHPADWALRVWNPFSERRSDNDRCKSGLVPKLFPTSSATRMAGGIVHKFSRASSVFGGP
jgi:hypothetical protein